jgi:type III secretory pathway lipoprotein EscJ
MDERTSLSPKQFPFYKHSHASFFIAYEKNRDVKVLSPNIKEGIKNI